MFTIYGGKTEFEQWGLDNLVTCSCLKKGDPVVFHGFGKNYETRAFEKDGKIYADVPNQILQESGRIRVDLGWGRDCHLDCRTHFDVVAREKPSDYEFHTNIKYKETENSGGGISGPVKWVDIQDKPFHGSVTEAPLDIQWDGQIGGRMAVAVSGAEGMYLVKLSDVVLTVEQLKQCCLSMTTAEGGGTMNGADEGVVGGTEEGLPSGVAGFGEFVMSFTDEGATAMAAVAPGVTSGTWSMGMEGYISNLHLWSDTVTVKTDSIVHLPNKYLSFVDVTEEPVAVLAEQTVTMPTSSIGDNLGMSVIALPVTLVANKTYRVIYDGIEYTLSDKFTAVAENYSVIKNLYTAYWSSHENDEFILNDGEFILGNWAEPGSGGPTAEDIDISKTALCIPVAEAGEHTIAIYEDGEMEETVKIKKEALPDTLPEEALPSGIWYGKVGQEQYEGDVLLETTDRSGSVGAGHDYSSDEECVALGKLKEGDRVIVTWNGEKFDYKVRRFEYTVTMSGTTSACSGLAVGNVGGYLHGTSAAMGSSVTLTTDEVDTGEEFVVIFEESVAGTAEARMSVMIAKESSAGVDHTVSIYAERYVNKLPECFIPELTEIVLCSSTEGSTKKFKVTIDDSGTLTPTEIT